MVNSATSACKESLSDSPGLVDFALVRLLNYVLNLPDGQVNFFLGAGEFKLQKKCYQSCLSRLFFGLVTITLELGHASYSLPFAPAHEGPAVCLAKALVPWLVLSCFENLSRGPAP